MRHIAQRLEASRSLVIGSGVLLCCVAIAAFVYLGNPFSGAGFRLDVVVSTANQVRAGAPVRIGGVDVGHVESVGPGSGATSRLRLVIDDHADRLHADATAAVLPRLVLEGNAYVALSMGTPAAPRMPDGGTIPLERSSVSVQLDQLLSEFDAPVRTSLKTTFSELAAGLGPKASGGGSGALALKRAARQLDASLSDVRRAARSLQGERSADLSRAVGSTGYTTEQLARDPAQLAHLVSNYRGVFSAFADNQARLRTTLRALDSFTQTAPARLAAIDRALPSVTRLARDLDPSLDRLPRTVFAADGAITQFDGLVAKPELPKLLTAVKPAATSLASAASRLRTTFAVVAPLGRCLERNLIPALNQVAPDGRLSSGEPVWKDLLHSLANFAGFSNTFDGNGIALRLGTEMSEIGLTTQLEDGTKLYGAGQISGRRPLGLPRGYRDVPYRPDEPCDKQDLPDLSQRHEIGLPAVFKRVEAPHLSANERALLKGIINRDKSAVAKALAAIAGRVTPRRGDRPGRSATPLRKILTPARDGAQPRPRPSAKPKAPLDAVPGLPPLVKPVEDVVDRVLGLLDTGRRKGARP